MSVGEKIRFIRNLKGHDAGIFGYGGGIYNRTRIEAGRKQRLDDLRAEKEEDV